MMDYIVQLFVCGLIKLRKTMSAQYNGILYTFSSETFRQVWGLFICLSAFYICNKKVFSLGHALLFLRSVSCQC